MRRAVTALVLCALALPALAQEPAQDWETFRDERGKVTVAYSNFDSGLGLAVRCVDRSFETVVVGLPALRGQNQTRRLQIAFGDAPFHDEDWNVTADPSRAVSSMGTSFARKLREGGRLRIRVPGGSPDGRNLVHDLDLPRSNAAIDGALAACGRPLADPRDSGLPVASDGALPPGLAWARQPRPRHPANDYARGFAVLTCLTLSDGRLGECEVEAEYPVDGGFGAAAMDAVGGARVQDSSEPGRQVAARRILFRINFLQR